MDFRLKVLSIYELGQRKNQEDYIYPPLGKVTEKDRLFIVCDGMGGHEKGEVASKTVCEKISEYIIENYNQEDVFTEDVFNAALSYAYDALDALDDGAEKKMGTTLTLVMFHNDGCLLAHIGDSRIYHIRPSEAGEKRIRYVTRDHSLVNDLVSIGEMSPEEARTSKQKNIITRAIQPNQERRSRADIYHIEDIRPGDYFYMCSDGMLEQAEDQEIANVISMSNKTDDEKVEMFRRLTEDNKDNHSAHLIKVLSVEGGNVIQEDEVKHENIHSTLMKILLLVLAVLMIGAVCVRGKEIKSFIIGLFENEELVTPPVPQPAPAKPSGPVQVQDQPMPLPTQNVVDANMQEPAQNVAPDPEGEQNAMQGDSAGHASLQSVIEQDERTRIEGEIIAIGQENSSK